MHHYLYVIIILLAAFYPRLLTIMAEPRLPITFVTGNKKKLEVQDAGASYLGGLRIKAGFLSRRVCCRKKVHGVARVRVGLEDFPSRLHWLLWNAPALPPAPLPSPTSTCPHQYGSRTSSRFNFISSPCRRLKLSWEPTFPFL
jgi:hypothetical protein